MRIIYSALITITLAIPHGVLAKECFVSKDKFKIGFFNGVFNTSDEARKNANALSLKYYKKEKQVELFYNQTEGLTLDLLEAFEQRFFEISPEKRSKGYPFYRFIKQKRVTNDSDEAGAISKFTTDKIRIIKRYLTAENTASDYADHTKKLNQLLSETSRVALVAHSQGNLFADHAFESLTEDRKKRVGVIHVASPSGKFHGKHILSSNDAIISGTRPIEAAKSLIGRDGKMEIFNIAIPRGVGNDYTGHYFNETYLNHTTSLSWIMSEIKAEENKSLPAGVYGVYTLRSSGFISAGLYDHMPITTELKVDANGDTSTSSDGYDLCRVISTEISPNHFANKVDREFRGRKGRMCSSGESVRSDIKIESESPLTISYSYATKTNMYSFEGNSSMTCVTEASKN